MSKNNSVEAHLQYLELDQDSIFELRQVKDILEPARDEIMDNWYALIPEKPGLNPLSCGELEIDQIPSVWVTLSPC